MKEKGIEDQSKASEEEVAKVLEDEELRFKMLVVEA